MQYCRGRGSHTRKATARSVSLMHHDRDGSPRARLHEFPQLANARSSFFEPRSWNLRPFVYRITCSRGGDSAMSQSPCPAHALPESSIAVGMACRLLLKVLVAGTQPTLPGRASSRMPCDLVSYDTFQLNQCAFIIIAKATVSLRPMTSRATSGHFDVIHISKPIQPNFLYLFPFPLPSQLCAQATAPYVHVTIHPTTWLPASTAPLAA